MCLQISLQCSPGYLGKFFSLEKNLLSCQPSFQKWSPRITGDCLNVANKNSNLWIIVQMWKEPPGRAQSVVLCIIPGRELQRPGWAECGLCADSALGHAAHSRWCCEAPYSDFSRMSHFSLHDEQTTLELIVLGSSGASTHEAIKSGSGT